MGATSEIGIYILQTLGGFYLLLVLFRFLLQVIRADFYNPISQFIVKATNPILIPLRKIIPSLLGYDTASVVLALLVQFTTIFISALFAGSLLNITLVLAWSALGILSMVVYIYFSALIIMIVLSFIAPQSSHPAIRLIYQLVNPVCAPFQKLLPAMGGLDFSPIFVFMALQIFRIIINHGSTALGLFPSIVPGI